VRPTVLLVEEDGASEPLAELLRSHGCRVWTASAARDALSMVQRGWVSPTMLILSLRGGRRAYELFLWACAAEPLTVRIPVVILSNESKDMMRALPGVVAVIEKPLRGDHLQDLLGVVGPGDAAEYTTQAMLPLTTPRDFDETTDPGS
jgi:DNA-binding response OmpR family regulator